MHRDSRVSQVSAFVFLPVCHRPVRRYICLSTSLWRSGELFRSQEELDPCLRELLQLSTTAVWGPGWLPDTEGTATSITNASYNDTARALREAEYQKKTDHTWIALCNSL